MVSIKLLGPPDYTFQSFLHMFCNMTNAPTDVRLRRKGEVFHFGTFMYSPGEPPGGWDDVMDIPIRY
jgi:hypothetical protein